MVLEFLVEVSLLFGLAVLLGAAAVRVYVADDPRPSGLASPLVASFLGLAGVVMLVELVAVLGYFAVMYPVVSHG